MFTPQGKPFSGDIDLSKAVWRKSSKAKGVQGPAVEVAFVGEWVALRESKPESPILIFNRDEWRAFVAGAKLHEFDTKE